MPTTQNSKSTLDFLGTIGSDDRGDKVKLNNVAKALVELSAFLIGTASDNMDRKKNVATGDTISSMQATDIQTNGTRLKIDVMIASTYKFLNDGVKGVDGGKGKYQFKNTRVSKRMALAILKWVRRRGLRARTYPSKYGAYGTKLKTGGRGKIEQKDIGIKKMADAATSQKSLAYAIATNIKKNGIEPTHFFSNAVKETSKRAKDKLGKALKIDIVESLKDLKF